MQAVSIKSRNKVHMKQILQSTPDNVSQKSISNTTVTYTKATTAVKISTEIAATKYGK